MSDQTIFQNQQQTQVTPETQTNQNTNQDPYADLLKGIKNDQGEQKYKTTQDALVGLQNAQNMIQTLLHEKRQIESEVTGLRTAAEKVSQLESIVLELQKSSNTQTPAVVDSDAIRSLVSQTLTQRQQEEQSKANLSKVAGAVSKQFGEKAEEVFYGKASEVGLSREAINKLAAESPDAALRLIGLTPPTGTQTASATPMKTGINTTSMEPRQDTLIGRNTNKLEIGAGSRELQQEMENSRKMINELAERGMSIDEMTKPSNYFKHF